MLNEHDDDVLLRCCRLGHEVTFGYCRRETLGQPCRLILDCWWERFDVHAFLKAHLSVEVMAQVERKSASPPPSKLMSLMEMAQQVRERLASENPSAENSPHHER
jgi:hypothetical protein